MDFDDDKHVLEMGSDIFRGKRQGPGLLEYDGDDVVADVSLSQQLAERRKRLRYQNKVKKKYHEVGRLKNSNSKVRMKRSVI